MFKISKVLVKNHLRNINNLECVSINYLDSGIFQDLAKISLPLRTILGLRIASQTQPFHLSLYKEFVIAKLIE
jgi:hypothetical protein